MFFYCIYIHVFFLISDFIWLFSLFKILRLMVSQLKYILTIKEHSSYIILYTYILINITNTTTLTTINIKYKKVKKKGGKDKSLHYIHPKALHDRSTPSDSYRTPSRTSLLHGPRLEGREDREKRVEVKNRRRAERAVVARYCDRNRASVQ